MSIFKNTLVSFLLILLTGCASVINGTQQEMTFNSEPEGALVLVDGLEKGRTPLTVKLKKDEYKSVTFKKEGYHDEVRALHTNMDPVAWVNILWDLSTTDYLTGALFEYAPSAHFVTMKKVN